MKALNFTFVKILATLRAYWVSGTPCQRLAVLVIRDQRLANQALTELVPRSTKNNLVFSLSCYCFFVSVSVG